MYIYHALINALSAHMIHINLNMIFYTHVGHSPTKTIYVKYYKKYLMYRVLSDRNVSLYSLVKRIVFFLTETSVYTRWQSVSCSFWKKRQFILAGKAYRVLSDRNVSLYSLAKRIVFFLTETSVFTRWQNVSSAVSSSSADTVFVVFMNRFNGDVGETSERRGFYERTDTILNWTVSALAGCVLLCTLLTKTTADGSRYQLSMWLTLTEYCCCWSQKL